MSSFTPEFNTNTGIPLTKDAFVVIVKTEWNAHIVDALEEGCRSIFEQNNIRYETLLVPGAFEIPFAIKKFWDVKSESGNVPMGFIALGCVLRGDTPHFDYVCKAVTDGVLQLNLSLPVPTIFGVLTVDHEQQAIDRIGGSHGHKGEEAAITALNMISLIKSFY